MNKNNKYTIIFNLNDDENHIHTTLVESIFQNKKIIKIALYHYKFSPVVYGQNYKHCNQCLKWESWTNQNNSNLSGKIYLYE